MRDRVSDRFRAGFRKLGHASRMRLRHGRPFSGSSKNRLLLLSIDERIPQSQIFPFHYHSEEIRRVFDTEIREIPVDKYMAGRSPGLDNATTVCFQTKFDISQVALDRLVLTIKRRNPGAMIVYLDWFAPTDLRLAERLDPHVAFYVKKHVFSDLSRYGQCTLGDTNLTDYYARRFGLDYPGTTFSIPPGFLQKLVIGPSFFTADFMIDTFSRPFSCDQAHRPIDLHARLGIKGSDWYQAMRGECHDAVMALSSLTALTSPGVGHATYLRELRASKLCFSPFGYGEVCWRDYEAVVNGAVLIKPDMSHIRTEPDIFVPFETYLPVRWDLSDFPEKVSTLLTDAALREKLTTNAYTRLREYVQRNRFISQFARVFDV